MTENMPAEGYLLVKDGLYYRPDGRGFTPLRDFAGRFALEVASFHVLDSDGDVTMVHERQAVEFMGARGECTAPPYLLRLEEVVRKNHRNPSGTLLIRTDDLRALLAEHSRIKTSRMRAMAQLHEQALRADEAYQARHEKPLQRVANTC